MFRNFRLAFEQFLEKLRKVVENLRENRQKRLVCLYNKQSNTWLLVDMEYLFSCSIQISRVSAVEHSKRNSKYLIAPMYFPILHRKLMRNLRNAGN